MGHVLLWFFLFAVIALFRRPENSLRELSSLKLLLTSIPYIALFYLHAYVIIPRYMATKNKEGYFISLLLLIAIVAVLSSAIVYPFIINHRPFYQLVLGRILPTIFFLAASGGYGVWDENMKMEKRIKEKETENLRSELSFLRSQVNPHFMMNVLNSLVALSRKDSKQMEPALIELGELMNYMLYNSGEESVSVEEELKYLQTYINLQMLRFSGDVKVHFKTEIIYPGLYIEPMLLIPLVENAFKHGIGLINDPVIDIEVNINKKHELGMIVRNKVSSFEQESKAKNSGIGLANLKKRLQLIYPGRFQLTTLKEAGWFNATLNLQLR